MKFSDKLINILYVEDEEDFREVMPAVILKDVEAHVSTIASGNLAIEALKSGSKFDLIISDYKMANGSGADLQQFMKKDGDTTPFILFTSTIEPCLPETSENFLGIVEKRDWKGLVDLIKEVQSNNT
jgi:DNA-binding NtrC family response regulator